MDTPPIDLQRLTNDLLELEQRLAAALLPQRTELTGDAVQHVPTLQTLRALKASVDRLRPLLWIYLRNRDSGGEKEPASTEAARAFFC
jgi:hypothetical protein